jgi:hypothetical protein
VRRETGPDDPGHNGKGRYGAVDASIDPVAQVVLPGTAGKPPADRLRAMVMLHRGCWRPAHFVITGM